MRRFVLVAGACIVSLAATPAVPQLEAARSVRAPESRKEIVAVFFGTSGTSQAFANFDLASKVRTSLQGRVRQLQRGVVLRGVSLEPIIEDGLKDLQTLGRFDEMSLGGNWMNPEVVRFLGPQMGRNLPDSYIPQVILLEREVWARGDTMSVTPEHEIGRLRGAKEIRDWVVAGTPITPR